MKFNKLMIICFVEVFLLISLIACGSNHIDESTPFFPSNGKENKMGDNVTKPIEDLHIAGLSTGNIIFIGNETDAYSKEKKIYKDDIFEYYLSGDYIAVGVKRKELMEELMEDDVQQLPEEELIAKGHEIIKELYAYYNESSELVVDYFYNGDNPLETIVFDVDEKLGDSIINNNTFSLSYDGSLLLFTLVKNDPSLFIDERMLTSSEIYPICMDELSNLKHTLEENNGYLPKGMHIDGLPQRDNTDNIIMFGEVGTKLPDFTMDIKNVKICRQEKHIFGDNVYWLVELQTPTSWGDYESIYNYIWSFLVDPYTGDIVHVEALSGAV